MLSNFKSVLLREIEKSAAMILRDPGLRAPMPRFRVISPQGECSVLYDREAILRLCGGRKRHSEDVGIVIISALGAFVQSRGASHCVYVTTADLPDLPKAIVAMVVDRQTGEARCMARQICLHPSELSPVAEVSVDDIEEGPSIVWLLLRDHSLEDARMRKAWELVLDDGVIQVVEEESWATDNDRPLH